MPDRHLRHSTVNKEGSMCPICWATALATFGGLLAISVVTIAAADIWTVAAAIVLAATSLVHRVGIVFVPWWLIALLVSVVLCRVSFQLAFHRDRLLVVKAWGRACQIAAGRCPKREL
jgi:hypothetical protein